MDLTIRKVLGHKLKAQNSVVEVLFETVSGSQVVVDIVPEAIGDLVLTLMLANTHAALLQDEGMAITPSEDRIVMHHLFPADKMYVVKQPNPDVCHVKMMTPAGAIFEFLVPSNEVFQQTIVPKE